MFITKKNKFLTGLLIGLALPLFEGLVDLGLNWLEVFKVEPLKKITTGNKEISDLQAEDEYVEKQPLIGFQYDSEEYFDEDE